MSFADKIKAAVGHPKAKGKVVIEVHCSEEAAKKLRELKTPTTIAGFKLESVEEIEPVDLGAAIRRKRSRCAHKNAKVERSGRERCIDCGDAYPCAGDKCFHLDCIEQRHALGIRKGFPRDYPYELRVLGDRHGGHPDDCAACSVAPEDHFEYMVDPAVTPERWILPFKLESP